MIHESPPSTQQQCSLMECDEAGQLLNATLTPPIRNKEDIGTPPTEISQLSSLDGDLGSVYSKTKDYMKVDEVAGENDAEANCVSGDEQVGIEANALGDRAEASTPDNNERDATVVRLEEHFIRVSRESDADKLQELNGIDEEHKHSEIEFSASVHSLMSQERPHGSDEPVQSSEQEHSEDTCKVHEPMITPISGSPTITPLAQHSVRSGLNPSGLLNADATEVVDEHSCHTEDNVHSESSCGADTMYEIDKIAFDDEKVSEESLVVAAEAQEQEQPSPIEQKRDNVHEIDEKSDVFLDEGGNKHQSTVVDVEAATAEVVDMDQIATSGEFEKSIPVNNYMDETQNDASVSEEQNHTVLVETLEKDACDIGKESTTSETNEDDGATSEKENDVTITVEEVNYDVMTAVVEKNDEEMRIAEEKWHGVSSDEEKELTAATMENSSFQPDRAVGLDDNDDQATPTKEAGSGCKNDVDMPINCDDVATANNLEHNLITSADEVTKRATADVPRDDEMVDLCANSNSTDLEAGVNAMIDEDGDVKTAVETENEMNMTVSHKNGAALTDIVEYKSTGAAHSHRSSCERQTKDTVWEETIENHNNEHVDSELTGYEESNPFEGYQSVDAEETEGVLDCYEKSGKQKHVILPDSEVLFLGDVDETVLIIDDAVEAQQPEELVDRDFLQVTNGHRADIMDKVDQVDTREAASIDVEVHAEFCEHIASDVVETEQFCEPTEPDSKELMHTGVIDQVHEDELESPPDSQQLLGCNELTSDHPFPPKLVSPLRHIETPDSEVLHLGDIDEASMQIGLALKDDGHEFEQSVGTSEDQILVAPAMSNDTEDDFFDCHEVQSMSENESGYGETGKSGDTCAGPEIGQQGELAVTSVGQFPDLSLKRDSFQTPEKCNPSDSLQTAEKCHQSEVIDVPLPPLIHVVTPDTGISNVEEVDESTLSNQKLPCARQSSTPVAWPETKKALTHSTAPKVVRSLNRASSSSQLTRNCSASLHGMGVSSIASCAFSVASSHFLEPTAASLGQRIANRSAFARRVRARSRFEEPPFLPTCSAAEVDNMISETHTKIQTNNFSDVVYQKAFRNTERKLLKWLIRLTAKELKKNFTMCDMEVEWIKRVARFYSAYVAYLQSSFYVSHSNEFEQCTVFVSHTSRDKLSYALPLCEFLEANNVSAFLDTNLRMVEYQDEQVLHALVTCEHCWCVVTEQFVYKEWSMRELMIAYTRFMNDEFSLIMDCFEDSENSHPVGYWMEFICKTEALKPYDKTGSSRPLTSCLYRTRDDESLDERMTRIAGQILPNGQVLVPLSQSSCSSLNNSDHDGCISDREPQSIETSSGIAQYEQFPKGICCNKIRASKVVRLLTTWTFDLQDIEDAVVDALRSGATLHVLLQSSQADMRMEQDSLYRNLDLIASICFKAGIEPGSISAGRVQVRLCDSVPTMSIYEMDEYFFVGMSNHKHLSTNTLYIGASSDTFVGKQAVKEIDFVWKNAKRIPWSQKNSPRKSPAVKFFIGNEYNDGQGELSISRNLHAKWSDEEDNLSMIEFDRFPTDYVSRKIRTASSIRIMTTWISALPDIEHALVDALRAGATLQILLLSPWSVHADARNRALEGLGVPHKYVQHGVYWNMEVIRLICKQAGIAPPTTTTASRVQIRFYDAAPSLAVYQTDHDVCVGFFCHGRLSCNGPHVVPASKTAVHQQMELVWNSAKRVPWHHHTFSM